jgi:hypothetical protein
MMDSFLDALRKFSKETKHPMYDWSTIDFFPIPLPQELLLDKHWETFKSMSGEERHEMQSNLDINLIVPLLTYTLRSLIRAIRSNNSSLLEYAALSLAVEEGIFDDRDVYCICAVFFDACQRLNCDARELLGTATQYAAGRRLGTLKYYIEHSPDYMKDLKGMGFRVRGEGGDFLYEWT